MAGIMDGEGTIAICRHRKKKEHNWSYGLFCVATNTNIDLLNWLQETTSLGKIKPKPKSESHWKLCYQWILAVEEIPQFLPPIMPFMIVRREHAELMMEFVSTLRWTGPSAPMSEAEAIQKQLIFEDLEILNKRGFNDVVERQ